MKTDTPPHIHNEKLDAPSNYSKRQKWYDREQYGSMLRGLIQSQLTQYKREKNRSKRTKIYHSIVYGLQVMNNLITGEKEIEHRLEALEKSVFKKQEIPA